MDPVGHKRIIIRLCGFMSLIDGSQLVPQFHPVATESLSIFPTFWWRNPPLTDWSHTVGFIVPLYNYVFQYSHDSPTIFLNPCMFFVIRIIMIIFTLYFDYIYIPVGGLELFFYILIFPHIGNNTPNWLSYFSEVTSHDIPMRKFHSIPWNATSFARPWSCAAGAWTWCPTSSSCARWPKPRTAGCRGSGGSSVETDG